MKPITQVYGFSDRKLAKQSKLGPQRLAQLEYTNVHRLCVQWLINNFLETTVLYLVDWIIFCSRRLFLIYRILKKNIAVSWKILSNKCLFDVSVCVNCLTILIWSISWKFWIDSVILLKGVFAKLLTIHNGFLKRFLWPRIN